MSAYEDRHWRMICLHPFGQAWLNRVEAIAHAMALHGSAAGKLHSKDKLHLSLTIYMIGIAVQACTMHLSEGPGMQYTRWCMTA